MEGYPTARLLRDEGAGGVAAAQRVLSNRIVHLSLERACVSQFKQSKKLCYNIFIYISKALF